MIVLWLLLVFVMTRVWVIAPTQMIRMATVLVGIAAGAFGTASSIAVLAHLKKNQRTLYVEELLSYEGGCKDE